MGRTLSVALAQYPPATGAQPIGQFQDQAAAICADIAGVELLVSPRSTYTGRGVWPIPGSVPEPAAGGVCNTPRVLDRTGQLISGYRKVFPRRPYETCSVGNEFTVFDIPETGRGGLCICAVIAYYFRWRDQQLNAWRYLLLPAIGAVIDGYLLTPFGQKGADPRREPARDRSRISAGADSWADPAAAGNDRTGRGRVVHYTRVSLHRARGSSRN